jgi:glycine/D-amino acid oxidase-like deaminating enzyme
MDDQSASLKNFDVVVVGGGLAGVFTAKNLVEKGFRVILLESRGVNTTVINCRGNWRENLHYNNTKEWRNLFV